MWKHVTVYSIINQQSSFLFPNSFWIFLCQNQTQIKIIENAVTKNVEAPKWDQMNQVWKPYLWHVYHYQARFSVEFIQFILLLPWLTLLDPGPLLFQWTARKDLLSRNVQHSLFISIFLWQLNQFCLYIVFIIISSFFFQKNINFIIGLIYDLSTS